MSSQAFYGGRPNGIYPDLTKFLPPFYAGATLRGVGILRAMAEQHPHYSGELFARAPSGLSNADFERFRGIVRGYYGEHGRELPWREKSDPYRIFVSEIMLQQTQVERVLKKYPAFIETFPGFGPLAVAPLPRVLALWQGMGYNRRAIHLKKGAEQIISKHGGRLPDSVEVLSTLPGVGKATAGAMAAFAYNRPSVFIETNIRRVFLHFFFPAAAGVPDGALLPLVERALDRSNPRIWYYALMDYGVMLKRERGNANTRSRHYKKQPPFEGSDRQVRGAILRLLVNEPGLSEGELLKRAGRAPEKTRANLARLVKEGFVEEGESGYGIAR